MTFVQFMDVLGDELVSSIENKPSSRSDSSIASRPLPSVPPQVKIDDEKGLSDSLDEPPPEIPQRTDARLELVDFKSDSVASPTYDIPGTVTTTGSSSGGGKEMASAAEKNVGYEQPTPCE